MQDQDLLTRLETAVKMGEFAHSPQWQLLNEMLQRTAARAKQALTNVPPDQLAQIVELQQMAKLYGEALPNLLRSFTTEGQVVFAEAQSRGLLPERTDHGQTRTTSETRAA